MTTVTIRDIPVKFPFTPYDIQKNYMEKVIECLETKQNGILESPTGTGKTLSLLCASLAWIESRKQRSEEQITQALFEFEGMEDFDEEDSTPRISVPTIIYASRTHTQLQQAMQEMKRTSYSHMRACVLGSREQMCIDQEVIQERNSAMKMNICRTKVKKNQCIFHRGVERQQNNPDFCASSILDMEDMVKFGRKHDFCPYYMARELKSQSDVVFMPYNYLLDPRLSKSMGVEYSDNVVILDEAHNIEKICEDVLSIQIKMTEIDDAMEDISAIIDLLASGRTLDVEINFTAKKLHTLNEMIMGFKNQLSAIQLVRLSLEGTVFDGDRIYQILENAGINESNFTGIMDLLDNIMEFLTTTKTIQRSGYAFPVFNDLFFVVFYKKTPEYRQKIKECFKIQIDEEKTEKFVNRFSQFSQPTTCRVLNFWCFSPGFGINMLLDRNIHCVILTSGTLAPLKPLISELELDVGVRIENPHIVKGDQVCVKILCNGPDMQLLNSNFKNRSNPKYIQSLGLVISNLIRVIPDGVLIFFPSYFTMEQAIEHWQENGTWDAINRTKPIYVEPKDKISFNIAMSEYYAKIQDPSYKGAIFMGVCRGKVSEGLDFADINGRAVFITGLPYPPLKDPKIILKKQYLDFRNSKDKEYLKGDTWYNLEATRAVNQAIGRVIRHKNDYGAIILLDSRFASQHVKSNMSLWLRQHICNMKNFSEIMRNIRLFFQNAQEKMPHPEIKPLLIEPLINLDASTSDNFVKIHSRGGSMVQSPSKKRRDFL